MIEDKSQWDAFRSRPRAVREAVQKSNWPLYALQCVKFAIYLVTHFIIVIGALSSKITVLILTTNLKDRRIKSNDKFNKDCGINNITLRDFRENEGAIILALFLIQAIPDIFAIIQSMYRLIKMPIKDHSIIISVCILEVCRTIGLSLIVFDVFPEADMARCLLLLCCIIFMPYFVDVIRLVASVANSKVSFFRRFAKIFKIIPKVLFVSILSSGAYLWLAQNTDFPFTLSLPIGLTLYGLGSWEGWISSENIGGYFDALFRVKYGLRMLSYECKALVSALRIAAVVSVIGYISYKRDFTMPDVTHTITLTGLSSESFNILLLSLVIVVINYFIRCAVRFLAAMKMRLLSFYHPAFFVPPLLALFILSTCKSLPICGINTLLKPYGVNWQCIKWPHTVSPFSDYYFLAVSFIIYLFWSYKHVDGKKVKVINEVIDSMPNFLNGWGIESSIVLFKYEVSKKEPITEDFEEDAESSGYLRIINSEIDKTVTLYVCATMWHETRNEMTQMIKSIMKLDEEHSFRLAEKDSKDLIKFKLEVHIFFDDAWVDDGECGRIPNDYFKLLFELLNELTENTDSTDVRTKILANTSYGGRLVVRLPAGALLFVHLKDKQMIRHKKRWSQVMYMYYLLGHRIMDSHLSVEDRQLQADNTYILAIDGDSKFEPDAVIKLLHLMNTKSDIGCACGRIHPIGDGVMVWYQKFEYAIAHWFQKAAEHVFGCVLCAPGCFSLFRASALMDDNIMHKYTKVAEEPRHYVQYDQGEDRWLSTLMLKQGYRIEYAAAADAETYAPEGFEEFFNQRRRWTPSSVANTLDLLADYKLATQNNNSISKIYILYQMLVIGFSLLGPAIIFTMLVYAQVSAFAMDSASVFMYNAIPVVIFIISCFCLDSSVQLFYAKIASIVYAFVMLAVLIATTQQIVLETIFSPTSMFVLLMVLIFLFASFVHPKEFTNIIFGAIFFLMIPSTYVFLSLYSLINLNVINWGTREAVAKATGKEVKKESTLSKLVSRIGLDDENSVIRKLLPCFGTRTDPRLSELEQRVAETHDLIESMKQGKKKSLDTTSMLAIVETLEESDNREDYARRNLNGNQRELNKNAILQARKGLWMECEYLQGCDRGQLKQSEERFWDQLIDKYLRPVESTPAQQLEVAAGLASLRNHIAFSIIILNGLLVLAIFLLQRHKDVLSIHLTPYEGFVWTKMNETTGKFEKTDEALKVDPLGMGIIFFLMGILIVQTLGMVIHRLNTLVEALHETSEMEEIAFTSTRVKSRKTVLSEARQMLDIIDYEKAHGADGYVRSGKMETKALNNVLYKLEREDENLKKTRRPRRK